MTDLKQCAQCKQFFPATTQFFWRQRKYLHSWCKTCANAKGRQYKGYGPKQKPEKPGDPRTCTKCGSTYPATAEYFAPQKGCTNDLRPDCRNCQKQRLHNYYVNNKPLFREHNRRWLENNREKANAQGRKRAETRREQNSERSRQWAIKNPAKRKIIHYRYVARKQSLPATLTPEQWTTALKYWGFRCAVCGRGEDLLTQIVPDHWIPVSKGGATVASNIIPLCHPRKIKGSTGCCNTLKNNRDPIEWLIDRLGEWKAKQKLTEIEAYFAWTAET